MKYRYNPRMRIDTSESPAPPPLIIPRPQHKLSRKDVEVEALKVLYRLYHAGYKAYLVGGSVRDLLLGKKPKDFDIVTDARPGEIRKLFRNSRIIGRRFRLGEVFFPGGLRGRAGGFKFPAHPGHRRSRGALQPGPGAHAQGAAPWRAPGLCHR